MQVQHRVAGDELALEDQHVAGEHPDVEGVRLEVLVHEPIVLQPPGGQRLAGPRERAADRAPVAHRGARHQRRPGLLDQFEEGVGRPGLAALAVAEDEGQLGVHRARLDGVADGLEHRA